MNEAEKKRYLTSCGLFAGLGQEALEDAARAADEAVLKQGELLFSCADGMRRIGVIVSGYARVTKPCKGGPVVMSLLGPGDVFGAASLMNPGETMTEARVIRQALVLLFSEEAFLGLMERHFPLAKNYCRYLVGRIRFLTERVECISGGTAAEKLMRYLEQTAEEGSAHVSFGMDALASALSMSRASLYRAFDELERAGRICRHGRDIKLIKFPLWEKG